MSAEQPYRVIAVRNECGDELVVYEYWLTRTFFGMVAGRRLKLSSGEEVVPVDDGSFMVANRGETYTYYQAPLIVELMSALSRKRTLARPSKSAAPAGWCLRRASGKALPPPLPSTKLIIGDWRRRRTRPCLIGNPNQRVLGSSPSACTTLFSRHLAQLLTTSWSLGLAPCVRRGWKADFGLLRLFQSFVPARLLGEKEN